MTHEARVAVPRDHPAFAGHFPGRPILPAVALLAEVIAAVERQAGTRAWDIAQAKFLRPVGPDSELVVRHEPSGSNVRFEVRVGDDVVASGTLAPRA